MNYSAWCNTCVPREWAPVLKRGAVLKGQQVRGDLDMDPKELEHQIEYAIIKLLMEFSDIITSHMRGFMLILQKNQPWYELQI